MSIPSRRTTSFMSLRANSPAFFRGTALILFAAVMLTVGVGFYRGRGEPRFTMKGLPTELSKDLVAEVSGYERRETVDGVLKYYVTAAHAKTFKDNHQELDDAYFEIYNANDGGTDRIKSDRAVYLPKEDKNFNAFLIGNVDIQTRDGLRVQGDEVSYDKSADLAETDDPLRFTRGEISGTAVGARVYVQERRLELLDKVDVVAFAAEGDATDKLAGAGLRKAHILSGRAALEQVKGTIALERNVQILLEPRRGSTRVAGKTDVRAENVNVFFSEKQIDKLELNGAADIKQVTTDGSTRSLRAERGTAEFDGDLQRVVVSGNVEITSVSPNSAPVLIKSGSAEYDKESDVFNMRDGVRIVTEQNEKLTTIRSERAEYDQRSEKINLFGNADITQPDLFIKGDSIKALLYPDKSLKSAESAGSALLRQTTPERATTVSADSLDVDMSSGREPQAAHATGNPVITMVPVGAATYSRIDLSASRLVALTFSSNNVNRVVTEGRTAIQMEAPGGNADGVRKRLTADDVKIFMSDNGRDVGRAEAVGSAELLLEPVRSAPGNYKTTITAGRFECDFAPGNIARRCAASGNTKTIRIPTIPTERTGTQTLVADKLSTDFDESTRDMKTFDASGKAKFSELDRHAAANQMSFASADGTVRLRGEPTVWDSAARAKAVEINWDTRSQKSFLNGKVSTTYYSQKSSSGSAPFAKSDSPVFITADTAEFDQQAKSGNYVGNARAWQDNNYVKADRLTFFEASRSMEGSGRVQSMLYNARRKEKGTDADRPVFAAADRVLYTDDSKRLHYEGSVDVRDGADRLAANELDVYLNDRNEMKETIAQNNVILTQPNRRAKGDFLQYYRSDEVAVLRGKPATVEDSENGSTQSAQLTVNLRENKVTGESKSKAGYSGRIRTVYKIKKQT
jgi:LPS export ABC transporter protein LptC/lipopolysaccharide transport protein LptA